MSRNALPFLADVQEMKIGLLSWSDLRATFFFQYGNVRKSVLWFGKIEKILKGSHRLQLQRKCKLWAGKFVWGVKVKHCWGLSTITQQCFALLPQVNFIDNNLNFHSSGCGWWDWIQAIFLNLFYFNRYYKISLDWCH